MKVNSRPPIVIFIEKESPIEFNKTRFGQINRDQFSASQTRPAVAIPMPTPWQQIKTLAKNVWAKIIG
jgi:hypothetical protein